MTDKSARAERQEAEPAEPERAAADIIYLPDQSQPEPAPPPPRRGPRRSGKMKGRHFGPRRAADPRTARFDVRCLPSLHEKLQAEAREAGLSLSAHVCKRLGGDPGPRARRNPGPDMAVLTRLLAELGKSGSNLNQIARQLNAGEDADFPELSAALTEHRAAVAVVMCALGVPPDADNY